ncbi:MAG: MFS transporter [Christensenellaceae bacterium]|jgi:hypothetical protein|nr:MFS transporter [Christensenellaceae bacterium]
MQQIKLLNFHKSIASFATGIIGTFIPLLIYQKTGSILFAFLFFASYLLLGVLFDTIFKKLYQKYPQIFLVLRIFPILIYVLSILLFDYNIMLGAVIVCIFQALSVSFQDLPKENIFNYSSGGQNTGKSLGWTRFLEQCGQVSAIVAGGLLLDYLNTYVVIIISVIVYLISAIPLLIYYFKERNNPTFNKESVSNAIETFKDIRIKNVQYRRVTRQMFLGYGTVYTLFCALDALMPMLMIYMFVNGAGSFAYAGYMQALWYLTFSGGQIFVSKIDAKKDTTKLAVGAALTMAALVCALPFAISHPWLILILVTIAGLCYGPISYHSMVRLLERSRIMGCSGHIIYGRRLGISIGPAIPSLVACAFLMPGFFVISGMVIAFAIFMPINDEAMRKNMVDYLQNNNLY